MESGIGATLRKARNRRKIDLPEVEAATKIRVRFLRAIEDEDWDALPGDAYAHAFIRTYAGYVGLDGGRLADEYRRGVSAAGAERAAPSAEPATVRRSRPPARSGPRGRVAAVTIVAGLAGVAVAIGLATGGDDPTVTVGGARPGATPTKGQPAGSPDQGQRPGVALELIATAEVWVCLLDSQGRPLVNGVILPAGAEEGPFRSGSFTVSLGNGEVSMTIDGQEAAIPETASPIGYAIDGDGTPEPLLEGERPTCL